jgi:hypothetical protein
MQLRVLGFTYEAIAKQCGYSDRQTAWNAVQREMKRAVKEPAENLRQLEAERLDALLRSFLPAALKGDVKAAGKVLDIMDRRARLFGLDVRPEDAVSTVPVVREYPAGVAAEV